MTDGNRVFCPHKITALPCMRSHPFNPPTELSELGQQAPIHRLIYPDGHHGWLVTGYSAVRKVLTDSRFSASSEFKRAPVSRPGVEPFYGHKALPGWLVDMDPPEHTRFRKALSEPLSLKRIKTLTPRIKQIVHEHLDAMEKKGSPVDLVESFALPVPSLTICELLGVPYDSRHEFQRNSAVLFSLDVGADEAAASMTYLTDFLRDLVQYKRRHAAKDLLSELISLSEFNDEEIAGMGVLLLTAGHETTANMLALGTYALISNPTQLAAFKRDPELIDNTVEELLRYLSIFHFGVPRTPLEDVELEGFTIKAGESMTLSLPAANRDPTQFDSANLLDIQRPARGHFAFGFGIHYCMGINLARIEMQIAYSALFQRFPTLHLAVPSEDIRLNTDAGLYGVHRLPVAW